MGPTEPADEPDRMLRDLGRTFVDALLAKHSENLSWEGIQPLECSDRSAILRQETVIIDRKRHSMDVLACISDKRARHVFLIEDKIDGDGDVEQLKRYYKILTQGRKTESGETKTTRLGLVPEEQVRAIYLDTGNHSLANAHSIERCTPFRVFNRSDFRGVLRTYRGAHPTVKEFERRLQRWEDETNSFRVWKRNHQREQWAWSAWQGLYRLLECEIDAEGWGYVPLGDFLGFWWHFENIELASAKWLFLQLQVSPNDPTRQKLCFKVEAEEKTENGRKMVIRDECREAILAIGKHSVERPSKMGVGQTMTVAMWTGDWLEFSDDSSLDIGSTASNLRTAQEIIDVASRWL